MLKLDLSRHAEKFLKKLVPKHAQQIAVRIRSLQQNPLPQDRSALKGRLGEYLRANSGEYRIIYEIVGDTLYVVLVGKRNDGDVYRRMKRMI